jgi:hypothetical protein
MDGQFTFVLGTQDSAKWDAQGVSDNHTISYSSGEKQVLVTLVCSKGPTIVDALGEDPINNYKFRVTSKCACWNGCKGKLF